MKKFLIALACLALTYPGARLAAQGTAAPSAGGTRIAVVNIGQVFSKYEKAMAYKKEMEDVVKPYKGAAEKLRDEIMGWQKELQKDKSQLGTREQLEAGILTNKRKLEDIERQLRPLIGKKQEEQLIILWRDVSTAVQATANANGFHLVLGYGDPADSDVNAFPNISRKMQALDMGAGVPLHFNSSIDISQVVIDALNRNYRGVQAQPVNR